MYLYHELHECSCWSYNISNHFSQGSSLSRPYLCQTNHSTTSLVPLHPHLPSVNKLICHGSCHSKRCGKTCLMAIKVVPNFIVKLCLVVSMCFLIETLSWRWYMDFCGNAAGLNDANSSRTSSVFESLPLAIKWLRETAQQNQSIQFQVKAYATISIVFSQMFHST